MNDWMIEWRKEWKEWKEEIDNRWEKEQIRRERKSFLIDGGNDYYIVYEKNDDLK